MPYFLFGLLAAAAYVIGSLRILSQYERGVVFKLGKYDGTREAGLRFVPLLLSRMKTISLRIVAVDVPWQDVITSDNITVKVNAVLYFRVSDPALAVMEIEDYMMATMQLAQTTLLAVLGQVELDELLADRKKVNDLLRKIIDERTEFWGVEISAVEIKDVQLPDTMRRAIARQAEAERERRAKIINAEGELQASETLSEAARVMSLNPASLQLRYLQTLSEIAVENNSTTIFPLPMDLFKPFLERAGVKDVDAVASAAQTPSIRPAPAPPALPAPAPKTSVAVSKRATSSSKAPK